MSKPELQAPPELYYNSTEASKYTSNSRIQNIQVEMAYRCLELLNLPPSSSDPTTPRPSFILDIGCGSGLSGDVLTEEGHHWAGVDVSGSMLEVALEREVEGDLFLQDIGQGFGFRPGSFDGAISVSVLQWLLHSFTPIPIPLRLRTLFVSLHSLLRSGSRAIFQFYPSSDSQLEILMREARQAGFGGGVVVDWPNSTKKKKWFLVLIVGGGNSQEMPKALGTGEEGGVEHGEEDGGRVGYDDGRKRERRGKGERRKGVKEKDRDWILQKKDLYRKRGKEDVPKDSKFTGRRRKPTF